MFSAAAEPDTGHETWNLHGILLSIYLKTYIYKGEWPFCPRTFLGSTTEA